MKWADIWGRFVRHTTGGRAPVLWRSHPSKIVVYADFIDPFCYIGFHNARRAAAASGIDLEWRGFELNPDTPSEGSFLLTAVNSDVRPGMWASVQDYAKKSGLILTEPTQVPNTRLVHLWVRSLLNGDVKKSLIERIYQAYLSDKKDIGNMSVLLEIAREFGLPDRALRDFAGQTDSSALEKYRQEALAYQFPGMPGFRVRNKSFFGALSEEAWKTILKETA